MRISPFLTLILLGAAPFFFLGGPGYHSSQSFKAAWDLGHVAFFCIFTILSYQCVQSKKPHWNKRTFLLLVFLCVLGLGILIELLQVMNSGRQPDPYDIARNQLGCLVGFGLASWKNKTRWLKTYRYFVIICLAITLWPFVRSIADERIAQYQFPVLSDFETPFERLRWVNPKQLSIQGEIARNGKRAMHVQLSTAKFSGTSLFYFPGNWEGYESLHFSVYNPIVDPLVLHCRIHDKHHKESGNAFKDRFHQKFILGQGWSELQVELGKVEGAPDTRSMDMQHIESFGFFVIELPEPRVIYIDNVYLSK